MSTNTRKVILIRMGVVYMLMCAFALLVLSALFRIVFVEGNKWQSMADSLGTRVFDVEAVRGNILDCNGNLLATSLPIYDVHIDGQAPAFTDETIYNEQIDSLGLMLSNEFHDKSPEAYKRLLNSVRRSCNRYYLLKRKLSYVQMQRLCHFPIFREGKYKGGLMSEERNRREKPFGLLAERTIGFTQKDVAHVGLEGTFDRELSGVSGKRIMQRIAGGSWVPMKDEDDVDAEHGRDLITTIDINLQDVAENALMDALVENDAAFGTAILMEVKTGEVRALANLTRTAPGLYTEKYNYAVGECMEPGSTFKLVSVMALLDDGLMKPDDRIDTENGKKLFCRNAVMEDSHEGGYGIITLQQAFEHSSNVAISKAV